MAGVRAVGSLGERESVVPVLQPVSSRGPAGTIDVRSAELAPIVRKAIRAHIDCAI